MNDFWGIFLGLFQRAISQSGNAQSDWAIKSSDPLKQAQRYADAVNCPTGDTNKMVECLKSATLSQLLDGHKETLVGTTGVYRVAHNCFPLCSYYIWIMKCVISNIYALYF